MLQRATLTQNAFRKGVANINTVLAAYVCPE